MKLFGGFRGERTKGKERIPLTVEPEAPETQPAAAAVPDPEPLGEVNGTPDASEMQLESPAPAEAPEIAEIEDGDVPEAEDRPVMRSPREQAEIEAIIAAYQKKKRRRRWIALIVILLLALGGWILWKTLVRPPEIVQPTPKPTPTVPVTTPAPTDHAEPSPEITPPPEETQPPVAERKRREDVYTFLLIGRDQNFGNTDAIMVGVYDAAAGTVDIVSIPRDTCANVESDESLNQTKKISGVYSRADFEGLRDAVADMVGFPIDCYVSVGVGSFVALVDTIGGVNYNIPYYMNYDDPLQDLHIHFTEGEHYLNGSDAIKVVRWRQNNDGTNYGDIARIENQQGFLKAVLKKCLSLNNLVTNLDDYIKIFQTYVKTDLSTGNMTWFAKEFLKLDMSNVRFHTMPSKYNDFIKGFSYGTIYVDEWLDMLNEYLNVYDQPITREDIDVIYRDENGNLAATSGEIRGGMASFLDMNDYVRRLKAWQSGQSGSGSSGNSGGEASGTESSGGEGQEGGSEAVEVSGTGSDGEETGGEEASGTGEDTPPPEPAPEDNTNGGE